MAGARVIEAAELRDRLAGLEPIGLGPTGTDRLAWTPELAAAEAWFGEQARGRRPAGRARSRRLAVGGARRAPGRGGRPGSHLDSVRGGGRFDGALGVAAGFAVAERAAAASR